MTERWKFVTTALTVPLLLGTACADRAVSQPAPSPSASELSPAVSPDIHRYYRQLEKSHLTDSGQFITTAGDKVSWYNSSQDILTQQATNAIYTYLQSTYTPVGQMLPYTITTVEGRKISARGSQLPHSVPGDKKLFLVSPFDPYPGWENDTTIDGGTSFNFPEAVVSYVVDGPSRSGSVVAGLELPSSAHASSTMATEICQQTLEIKANNNNQQDTLIVQEAVCNSFGLSWYFRQEGLSYTQYVQTASE